MKRTMVYTIQPVRGERRECTVNNWWWMTAM